MCGNEFYDAKENILKVAIINNQQKVDIDINFFKKVADYVAGKFNLSKKVELNIIFVNKQEISILNKKYRKKESPTDVLSFSYNNFDKQGGQQFILNKDAGRRLGLYTIGEIVICPEVAQENIKRDKIAHFDLSTSTIFNNWDIKKEIVLLIIHGILHIYGYCHEKRDEAVEMESLQDSLLNDVLLNYFSLK